MKKGPAVTAGLLASLILLVIPCSRIVGAERVTFPAAATAGVASLEQDEGRTPNQQRQAAIQDQWQRAFPDHQQSSTSWSIQTLSSTYLIGWDTSLALDGSGNPHIAYHDSGYGTALKHSWWNGTTWQTEPVGSARGDLPSLAVDATGNPRIAYISNQTLQYAYKDTSGWHFQTLDPANSNSPSMALDGSGRPYVVYIDLNYELKYARWDGSAWVYGFVDQTRYLTYPSLSLDGAGNPRVSYHGGSLYYAHWDGSAWQTETVDGTSGIYGPSFLALDAAGHPNIAYYDNTIKAIKYAFADSSGWHVNTVDDSGQATGVASVAIDSSQRPNVFYTVNSTPDGLNHAVKIGGSWCIEPVQGSGSAQYVSAAIDKSVNPNMVLISYSPTPDGFGYLKYARVPVSNIFPPSVITAKATAVTLTSVQLNGRLISLGSAASANVSIEWGTASGNYPNETPPQVMNTLGNFSANLTGLVPSTLYFFRAIAVSSDGSIRGEEKAFFTILPTRSPLVITGNATNVTYSSATLNGVVTSMGQYSSLMVYFEFGPTSGYGTKTSYNQFVADVGPFSFTIHSPNVLPNTLYHYRAVIDLGGNRVYGQDATFTTLPALPTVTTNSIAIHGVTLATLNGNLTSLGTAASVTVSFEYGTSLQYGRTTQAQRQSSPGLFTADITGLLTNTLYHFRAKADGGVSGTAFGEDMSLVMGMPAATGKIAFISEREGLYESKVYLMNASGNYQTKLTGPIVINNVAARDWSPSCSPDGSRIAFYSSRDGNANIYVVDTSGIVTALTSDPHDDAWPVWSPDGNKIAFLSNRIGRYQLYVMNADGSGQTRVTNNTNGVMNPRWRPDGTLAYDAGGQTYLINSDGSNLRSWAGPSGVWSPDGTKIAFVAGGDIYVSHADGSGQTRLTNSPGWDLSPSWSPDSRYIAFSSDRDGPSDYGYTRAYDIYVMNADGSNQTRITTDGFADLAPSWTLGDWTGISPTVTTGQASIGKAVMPPPLSTLAPASFAVSDVTVNPTTAIPGQSVTVSAKISNTGGTSGECSVTLKINSIVETTKNVLVGAGGTSIVSFTVTRSAPGKYQVDINGASASFDLQSPEPLPTLVPQQAQAAQPQPTRQGANWIIVGIVVGVIVLAGGRFAIVRLRRRA